MVSCSLNSDKFLVAMLQLRNTPYRDCQKSLAEIIYEHQLQDNVAFLNNLDKFSNTAVCPVWREALELEKEALCTRLVKNTEAINHNAKKLQPMYVGSRFFQNEPHQHKWDRSGVVMKVIN